MTTSSVGTGSTMGYGTGRPAGRPGTGGKISEDDSSEDVSEMSMMSVGGTIPAGSGTAAMSCGQRGGIRGGAGGTGGGVCSAGGGVEPLFAVNAKMTGGERIAMD